MKKYSIVAVILSLCLLLPLTACALGPKVVKSTAVWDPNTETDLAGYYLYWRSPTGVFSDANRVMVDISPTPKKDLMTLSLAPAQYFIAVSAFDSAGNESALSNEVPWDNSYPAEPKNAKVQ